MCIYTFLFLDLCKGFFVSLCSLSSFFLSDIMKISNVLYIPFKIKSETNMLLDMRMVGFKNRKHCQLYLSETKTNQTNNFINKLQLHNEFTFIILESNNSRKQFGKLCIRSNKVEIIDYSNHCQQETNFVQNHIKIAVFSSPYLPFIGKNKNI